MNTLTFRLAKKEDLDDLFNIYTDAIKEMERNNIHQWDEFYPDESILAEDIQKRQLYIGIYKDQIACSYVLNQQYDEAYDHAAWQYPNATYYILHRLCVNPLFQKQKIATQTMCHLENQVRAFRIDTIRLDVFSENPYALKLYQKLSYHQTGTATWRKGLFYLMEKKL